MTANIPVAYCGTCDDTGPVVIQRIEPGDSIGENEIYGGEPLEMIYCPGCLNFLNSHSDIEVKFYDEEDLEKVTGWKVKKDDSQ
jgi:hypothetical protein